MSKIPTKVFIKVESAAEQQEHLTRCRKSSKVFQKIEDKENYTRSPFHPLAKNFAFTKSKSADIENIITHPDTLKRKQIESKSIHTQTEAHKLSPQKKIITAEDLTSTEGPGEHYWELMARKQADALADTLEENKNLYERIDGLEQELEISKKMIEEAKSLVEVLTEMLEEKETENDIAKEIDASAIINVGASTSAGDSCYFEATNFLNNSESHNSDSD